MSTTADLTKIYDIDSLDSEIKNLQDILATRKEGYNLRDVSAELAYKMNLSQKVKDLKKAKEELDQTQELAQTSSDKEMKSLIQDEITTLQNKINQLSQEITQLEIERKLSDPDDNRSVILEIRAGAGGDEASIFAADLFRMYRNYANSKGWKVSVLDYSLTEANGYKEIVAKIEGKNVYKELKYESGVHRVQRIPVTESSGRIHTSTASVAILPEAEEIDIEIKPSDIRVDVMRATGAGGQCVNTTDSAVRITHLETGIVVSCQETKHQLQNREKAMQMLRTKLYQLKKEEEHKKRSDMRLSQIGSGMRAEKIRTYNFPQSRVTDHRIKKSWFNLEDILNGDIEEVLQTVKEEMQKIALAQMQKEDEKNK